MSNKNTVRSIRSKDDPKKPCNVAYADGRDARMAGSTRESCPFAGADAYDLYLREHWLRGFDEVRADQAVCENGFIHRQFEGADYLELQCPCGAKVSVSHLTPHDEAEDLHRLTCGTRRREDRDADR